MGVIRTIAIAAALGASVEARAAPAEQVALAERRVRALAGKEAEIAQLFDAQRELERSISGRKAAGDRGSAKLERELEAALALEEELGRLLDDKSDLSRAAHRAVKVGVAQCDTELERLIPALRSGSTQDRRAAAQRIQELRGHRARLIALRSELRPPARASIDLDWADVDLQVDPLDGPEDIHEKADFVEDARDRLRTQRERLTRLVERARQTRAMNRVARAFTSDMRLFDESTRSPSPTATTREREAVGDGSARGPAGPTAGAPDGMGAAPGEQSPGNDFSDVPSEPGTGSGLDGQLLDVPNIPPSFVANPERSESPAPESPGAPSAPVEEVSAAPGPVVSGFSPDDLLNLSVDTLDPQRMNPETLERLASELEALDRMLAARALEMRMKARALERLERSR